MKEKLLTLIKKNGDASFAGILQHYPEAKGDMEMIFEEYENLILWRGLTNEAILSIVALLDEGQIHMNVVTPLVYLIDGLPANLPTAKSIRSYKKPHWLPVVFEMGAKPKSKSAK